MNGSEAGVLFSLKAYMTQKPYTILVSLMICSLLILGFVIRLFEVGLLDKGNRFPYITNALWLVA